MTVRRLALALTCALLLLLGGLRQAAEAHAVLVRATPSPTQSLAASPASVELLFSESIDPDFSTVRVMDAKGTQVDTGDGHVDPNNDRLLVASLQSNLPNGIYTVQWRSLSTIDVHPDEGRYSLFVGVPAVVEPQADTVAASVQNTSTPETTFARWWFYLAASVLGGGLAAWRLVIAPLLRGSDDLAFARAARPRVQRLVFAAGVLLIVGTLFAAVAQAAAAANVPLPQALGQPLVELLGRGRFAAIWWPRFGIELAAVALIGIWGLDGTAAESAMAMMPAILLTTSLTSHGAALPSGASLGIIVDWLHVLGAAVWVGGLAVLVVLAPLVVRYASSNEPLQVLGSADPLQVSSRADPLLPRVIGGAEPPHVISRAEPLLQRMIRRFSRLGMAALGLVAVSGALQAALEVGGWGALVSTIYGQLVLAKVVLLGVMTVLATLNTFARASVPFFRGVRFELAAGAVVLAVAAMLTGLAPARNFLP